MPDIDPARFFSHEKAGYVPLDGKKFRAESPENGGFYPRMAIY